MSRKLAKNQKAGIAPEPPQPPMIPNDVPSSVETPPQERPKMIAKVWRPQPDIPLGLHPSVAATLQSLANEIVALETHVAQRKMAIQFITLEQIKYYQQPHDESQPISWQDGFNIMLIPQHRKLDAPSDATN